MKFTEIIKENHESDDELFGKVNLVDRIESLLQAKQKVFTQVLGAMGQVMYVQDGNLILRTRPRSTTRYSWGGAASRPDDFKLERNAATGIWYLLDKEDVFEESDESDDELFGVNQDTTKAFTAEGLPVLPPALQQQVMQAADKFIRTVRGSRDWHDFEDDIGEDDAMAVYNDFLNFRKYIADNNLVAALAMLEHTAIDYEWDQTFGNYIERHTGINLWGLIDMDNPNVEAAYDFYRRRPMQENDDESDDDLFGVNQDKNKAFTAEGLPVLSLATQQELLKATNNWLRAIQRWDDWLDFKDEAGEAIANAVYQDFIAFRDQVRDNNIIAAIGSIQRNANAYDWDDPFQTYLDEHSGIDIWDLVDLEDPNQEAAYDFYTGRRRVNENDPERPRKTKTKTKPDIKLDIPFQQDQDHPLAKADPLDDLKKKAGINKPEVNLRKASQKDTLSKTSGLGTPEMGDMLSKLRNIEIDKDLGDYPDEETTTEVNTSNLPAIAGQALQAAGTQDPEFHQVANLPGNMSAMIRQLGKSLFGSLTSTPTKDIFMVANLGGKGPNTIQEVNAVAGFLKEHGEDRGPGDIDFEKVMPGYKAQTHMYSASGIRWMLVKDFAGQYIYCWPESDSLDANPKLGHSDNIKKLK